MDAIFGLIRYMLFLNFETSCSHKAGCIEQDVSDSDGFCGFEGCWARLRLGRLGSVGTVDFSECYRHALIFYRRVHRAAREG